MIMSMEQYDEMGEKLRLSWLKLYNEIKKWGFRYSQISKVLLPPPRKKVRDMSKYGGILTSISCNGVETWSNTEYKRRKKPVPDKILNIRWLFNEL